MRSCWVWVAVLAACVAAVVWSVAVGKPELNLALSALSALGFAVVAAVLRARLVAKGAGEVVLASASADAMAAVWAWAGISVFLAYVFFLSWHEWWQYVVAAGAIAALCAGFSAMLSRDAAAGREDATMLKLARYLTWGQLVGMIIAMIGLILDDKMPRDPVEPDWAANTIFFFGAAALAAISAIGLRGAPARQS